MIDVNAMAEAALSNLKWKVVYYHPNESIKLPCVSWYTISEKPKGSYDNNEWFSTATIVVDVWAKTPKKVGEIALEVNSVLNAEGWKRNWSMDVAPDDGVYRKSMRFSTMFRNTI